MRQLNRNDPWPMGRFLPWRYSATAWLSSTNIDGAGEKSRRHRHLDRGSAVAFASQPLALREEVARVRVAQVLG